MSHAFPWVEPPWPDDPLPRENSWKTVFSN